MTNEQAAVSEIVRRANIAREDQELIHMQHCVRAAQKALAFALGHLEGVGTITPTYREQSKRLAMECIDRALDYLEGMP